MMQYPSLFLLLCIFWQASSLKSYPYAQTGVISVSNSASLIFTANGLNVTQSFSKTYTEPPKVLHGIVGYQGLDQTAQQCFKITIVSITSSEFTINIWESVHTSTKIDNITISFIAIQDIYSNVIVLNEYLSGFSNVRFDSGPRQDILYLNPPQLNSITIGNLSNYKLIILNNGFYESTTDGFYLGTKVRLTENGTIQVTVQTDGQCTISSISISILIIDESKFPQNVTFLAGQFPLSQIITNFSIDGLDQADIIFGISGFEMGDQNNNFNYQLVNLNSAIFGQLGYLNKAQVSYFAIAERQLNQSLAISQGPHPYPPPPPLLGPLQPPSKTSSLLWILLAFGVLIFISLIGGIITWIRQNKQKNSIVAPENLLGMSGLNQASAEQIYQQNFGALPLNEAILQDNSQFSNQDDFYGSQSVSEYMEDIKLQTLS